jgi:hypothetical protein
MIPHTRVIAMRSLPKNVRTHGFGRVIAWFTGALVLAGCSSPSGTGSSESWLGSTFFAKATPGVTQAPSPTPSAPAIDCPGVDIRQGASTLNIAAKGEGATAGDLRYQLSFGQTARECIVQGNDIAIKVGVQGRVIVGPMGGPGAVEIPLRYAVVREGPEPKTVTTKLKRIPVSIGAGETHVQFVDIEEGLTFPMPTGMNLNAYVVYVGFDEIADKKPAKGAKGSAQRQK